MKYEVKLYWSEEDNAFIAEVPELAGCMADVATEQEALANAEIVAREWIETARELGREIPQCSSFDRAEVKPSWVDELTGVIPSEEIDIEQIKGERLEEKHICRD